MAQDPKTPQPIDETLSSSVAPRRSTRAGTGDVLVERYELGAELGRGAFGVVYRAHDRVADTEVAIKILSASSASGEAVTRLRRELQAAWKVTHPGVVRVHDVIDLGNRLALLMELVDGETLDRHLVRGKLAAAELIALAHDLARAVAAAHRAGVTHRDLKPSNVILRRSTGRPVITDFGLSLLPGFAADADGDVSGVPDVELTRSEGLCGTPRYMAPEQLAGGDAGPSADVYALGLILYEAATGERPYEEKTIATLRAARLTRSPPSLAQKRPDLPAALTAAIDRCLQRDPAQRFPSAVELRAALDPFRAPTAERPAAAAPPRRRWTSVAAALVLMLAAGLIAWPLVADRLPRHDRRLAFTVEPDDELGHVVQEMTQHRLARADHFVRLAGPRDANVHVKLRWRKLADGSAALDVELGRRAQHLVPIATVQGASMSAAVDAALVQLRARVDAGQSERGPDDDERRRAALLSAPDIAAFRAYDAALSEIYGELIIDVPKLTAQVQKLIDAHPSWLHPYALLINTQGNMSPAARATLDKARAVQGGEPIGRLMVEAAAQTDPDRLAGYAPQLDRAFAAAPDDTLLGWLFYGALHRSKRGDEALAVTQTLNRTRPDLQFGSDVEQGLRQSGRAGEVAAQQAAWLRAAPDNPQALASRIIVEFEAGNGDAATTHARDLIFLYGPSPQRLVLLCDVLLETGQLREAARYAEQLLRSGEYERALAWIHLGQIALLQGRISAALEAWNMGVQASRPFGVQGPLFQTLEELASAAAYMHADEEMRSAATELVKDYREVGDYAQAFGWQVAVDAPRCPSLKDELARLPSGAGRAASERQVVRALAAAGCVPCADAVRLGVGPIEPVVRSLYNLGICAEREGQLQLAADVFERAETVREIGIHDGETPSTVSSILAGLHRARVLDRLGRKDEARALYRRFYERWQHADRTLSDVEDARKQLQ